MDIVLWTLIAFLSGSIPFSVIAGRVAADVDIRKYGDHNPGATNVLRATGWGWGALAGTLDYLKGAVPGAKPQTRSLSSVKNLSGWRTKFRHRR